MISHSLLHVRCRRALTELMDNTIKNKYSISGVSFYFQRDLSFVIMCISHAEVFSSSISKIGQLFFLNGEEEMRQYDLLVFALHVFDEVDDSVGVAHLIVVPRHELDKSGRELNAGLGVKDGGVRVAQEVSGHHHVFSV